MVRYLSILTLSLFAASTARAVPLRVLMENVSATNSALFVSTRAPYGITVPQIVVSSGVTAATGTFSGAVSAGSFSGPLTGNVTGNVTGNATTATTATNIAGGTAGQIPYQTGAGATSFVGPGISSTCASGFHLSTTTVVNGIITGGGCISDNNFPNTGNTTYSLTASSGASFGSDLHVTGTLEATKLKGDGSQLTGIAGGGTVTTSASPANGNTARFTSGTAISSGAFTDNGSTVTAPSGSAFVLAAGSTMTAGPVTYSTTFTITGLKINDWNTVAISTFVGASAVNFTGFLSTTPYRATCTFIKHTDGNINAQVDGDAGANYYSGCSGGDTGVGVGNCSQSGATSITLTGSAAQPSDGTTITIVFQSVQSGWSLPKVVNLAYKTVSRDNSNTRSDVRNGTLYHAGTVNFSSLKLSTSAGTVDGSCIWEAFIQSQALPIP
jgi:hypothetical protein